MAIKRRKNEVNSLGPEEGASNLVTFEVLLLHVNEHILGKNDRTSLYILDTVARIGGYYYLRANGEAILKLTKLNHAAGTDSKSADLHDG